MNHDPMPTVYVYLDSKLLGPVVHFVKPVKTSLLDVWAEQNAQYTWFLPQTSQEGNECTTTYLNLRANCPNIYNVAMPIVKGLLFAHWVHNLFEELLPYSDQYYHDIVFEKFQKHAMLLQKHDFYFYPIVHSSTCLCFYYRPHHKRRKVRQRRASHSSSSSDDDDDDQSLSPLPRVRSIEAELEFPASATILRGKRAAPNWRHQLRQQRLLHHQTNFV